MNSKQKGFTLIELLVVIAIIGLLSTLSVVALNNARQKARNARRMADIKQVQTALELYYNDQSGYPGQVNFNGSTSLKSTSTTYMTIVPANPSPRNDGSCPDSNYRYKLDTGTATYHIWYCLGESTGGVRAGTNCATPAGLSQGTSTSCGPND